MKTTAVVDFMVGKKQIIIGALALVFAYLLIPVYFVRGISALSLEPEIELWRSLDPSWNVAMSFANIRQLVWGQDFVFTYGPLVECCTRIGVGTSKWILFAFDGFVFLNYFLLARLALLQSKNTWVTLLLLALVVLIFPEANGASQALILLGFLVFWARVSLDGPKVYYFVLQIAILTILFFLKFNTGLIVFPLYLAGLFYHLIHRKVSTPALLAYALAPFLLIALLAIPLNVAIVPYVKAGLEMVSGFNDVMYFPNQLENSTTFSGMIVLLLTVVMLLNIFLDPKKRIFEETGDCDFVRRIGVCIVQAVFCAGRCEPHQ